MKCDLVLKNLYSDEFNIRGWRPESNDEIFVKIILEIGLRAESGTNNFRFVLATPEALLKKKSDKYMIVENRTIIVTHYDYFFLKAGIEDIVQRCAAYDFDESCLLLTRYFDWEYEDYKN